MSSWLDWLPGWPGWGAYACLCYAWLLTSVLGGFSLSLLTHQREWE